MKLNKLLDKNNQKVSMDREKEWSSDSMNYDIKKLPTKDRSKLNRSMLLPSKSKKKSAMC